MKSERHIVRVRVHFLHVCMFPPILTDFSFLPLTPLMLRFQEWHEDQLVLEDWVWTNRGNTLTRM